MIDFSGYTYAEILQQMLDRVDNSLDKREGSLIQTALAPGAWYLEGLALTLNQVQQAAYVTTATGQDLDYLTLNRGITRIAATVAVRKGVFNVQIPEGTVFKTINGENSVQFETGAYIGSESGNFTYRMICQTAGEIGNNYSGNIIPATSFAGSTDLTTAYIGEIIVPGTNEETDEALRSRFIASLDAAPYGGNISEYRQAILAIAGVGGVQVYPANYYNGGDDSARRPYGACALRYPRPSVSGGPCYAAAGRGCTEIEYRQSCRLWLPSAREYPQGH